MSLEVGSELPFWRYFNPLALVRDIHQHRRLLWKFIVRNVHLRHKGSYLGLMWVVISPLLMMGLYTLVFGIIFGGRYNVVPTETTVEYSLGIFLSLTIFQLVSETMGNGPLVIASQPNFVKKVVFPLEVLPLASLGATLFHFGISVLLVLIGIVALGPGLALSNLWLPVIILPVILAAAGLSWLFAALGVFMRDIAQFMLFLTSALLFSSAIFFSASMFPQRLWVVMKFNPMIHALEMCRNVMLWHTPIDLGALAYLYGVGIFLCLFGYACFQGVKPFFSDVL